MSNAQNTCRAAPRAPCMVHSDCPGILTIGSRMALVYAFIISLSFAHPACRGAAIVAAWGSNAYGQTNVPPGLTNVVAVAAGPYHSLALKAEGTVVAWGSYWNGGSYVPVFVPDSVTNVIA